MTIIRMVFCALGSGLITLAVLKWLVWTPQCDVACDTQKVLQCTGNFAVCAEPDGNVTARRMP